jgi:hypothetical protein
MIGCMKQRLIAILLSLTFVFAAAPSVAFASNDEDAPTIDARLDGYKDGSNMGLKDASGAGLTWLLLIVLAAMCVGVMFINSKRSHLD